MPTETLVAPVPLADTLDAIASHYTRTLREHGAVSNSVGWKDPSQQVRRFRELARVIPAGDAPFTVADYGCGYGAMFTWLDATYPGRMTAYTGTDISAEMLAAARGTITDSRAEFVQCEQLDTTADFVFVSGTFNLRLQAAPEAWGEHVGQVLDQLWARATCGLAFNLLTSHVDWRADGLFYADPARFLDRCLTRYSRWSSLVHDYPMYEWTMLVSRCAVT